MLRLVQIKHAHGPSWRLFIHGFVRNSPTAFHFAILILDWIYSEKNVACRPTFRPYTPATNPFEMNVF